MVLLLVALLAASQPAQLIQPEVLGHARWIFSTIGHSEWCPPGNLRLDLQTGSYALTVRAPRPTCNKVDLERSVRTGTFSGESLARLRAASQRVVIEGMRNTDCRNGREPPGIVINNGGVPLIVLATGSGVAWTPDDLGCWSKGATALQAALDDAFVTRDWR